MSKLLDRLFIWLYLLFVSIFLVLISILSPITIDEHEELQVAMFGYPIPFAQQDLMTDYGDYLGRIPPPVHNWNRFNTYSSTSLPSLSHYCLYRVINYKVSTQSIFGLIHTKNDYVYHIQNKFT